MTGDGYEQTFQVNVLAPYLLMRLLAERLRTSEGRVITTSSVAHTVGRLDMRSVGHGYSLAGVRDEQTGDHAALIRSSPAGIRDVGVADFHPGAIASEFLARHRTSSAAAQDATPLPDRVIRAGRRHAGLPRRHE